MRVDYCPECNKSGLRYEDPAGKDPDGIGLAQRMKNVVDLIDRNMFTSSKEMSPSRYGLEKYCPRCQKFVIPRPREWRR